MEIKLKTNRKPKKIYKKRKNKYLGELQRKNENTNRK